MFFVVVVQSLSQVWLFAAPWFATLQASLSFTRAFSNSCPLSWWCHTAILSSVIPFFSWLTLSQHQGLFSWVALHIRWSKHWSFRFSISPSNENSRLISFRIDWFDLLAVQGTLKSLQHHSSKAYIFRCSAFLMVQLAHLHLTTGKIFN